MVRLETIANFRRAVVEVWQDVTQTYEWYVVNRDATGPEAVLKRIGHRGERPPVQSLKSLLALTVFGGDLARSAFPLSKAIIQRVLEGLAGRAQRHMVRQLDNQLPQLWELTRTDDSPSARSPFVGQRAFGRSAEVAHPIAAADSFVGQAETVSDGGWFVGWRVSFDGVPCFISAAIVDERQVSQLMERVSVITASPVIHSPRSLWGAVEADLFRLVATPSEAQIDELALDCVADSEPDAEAWAEREVRGISPRGILRYVARRLEKQRCRKLRYQVAEGGDETVRTLLLGEMTGLRRQGFGPAYRSERLPNSILERHVPTRDLLALWGFNADGSMPIDPPLESRPLALLGLNDETLAHAGLAPTAPIKAGLKWAQDNNTPPARLLREAFTGYRTEMRWMATLSSNLGDIDLDPVDVVSWENLLSGLWRLFDSAFFEATLEEIGLDRGTVSRLQWLASEAAPRLADLPMKWRVLRTRSGIGGTTITRLKHALFEYAQRWRLTRVGLTEATLSSQAERALDANEDIASGLAALADLFGE